jgi:hypothetical protein
MLSAGWMYGMNELICRAPYNETGLALRHVVYGKNGSSGRSVASLNKASGIFDRHPRYGIACLVETGVDNFQSLCDIADA